VPCVSDAFDKSITSCVGGVREGVLTRRGRAWQDNNRQSRMVSSSWCKRSRCSDGRQTPVHMRDRQVSAREDNVQVMIGCEMGAC